MTPINLHTGIMIQLQHIDITRYGEKLLQNVTWKIEAGEHWVIQGDNGAGKTTLLDVLAGTLTPARGEVRYDFIEGNDWTERYNARKEKIHYVPAHALQIFLAGYHDLFYQQRYYSIGDTTTPRVKDILGQDLERLKNFNFPPNLNIDYLLNLEITRLSNGQLKKILLLKNLLKNIPRVLLFDYPFEGLDQESRKDLIRFIDYFATTFTIQIIIVDHHHDLPRVINRKLVLHKGRIERTEIITHAQPILPQPPETVAPVRTVASTAVAEMKSLTIQYDQKIIIRNLNWTINKGERWALTGKNGSGKTTLFSLIFADHPMAYSQQVYLFGKRRGSGESIWDIKRRINYLGPEQIHYLNPKSIVSSARQYIISQRALYTEDRLNMLVAFFQCADFIDKPVRHLSSGELQCMLLLNFFLSDKELLLLDEPFQFLDPLRKEKVNEYLSHYLHEDTTLVLITHYEEDIKRWTQLRMAL